MERLPGRVAGGVPTRRHRRTRSSSTRGARRGAGLLQRGARLLGRLALRGHPGDLQGPGDVLVGEHAGRPTSRAARGRAHLRRRREFTRLFGPLGAPAPRPHPAARLHLRRRSRPRRIDALEPDVRRLAVGMIERIAAAGRADLVDRPRLRASGARDLPAASACPTTTCRWSKQWAASRVMLNFGDLPVEEQVRPRREPGRVLALLRGPRRVALRAAAGRPHRRVWRRSTSAGRPVDLDRRDGRADPHPALRRPRDDHGAARRGAEGAARASADAGRSCATIRR